MRIAAACSAIGLAVGAVLLLALRYVVGPRVLDGVGWSAYGMPRRYVDYLPTYGSRTGADLRESIVVLGAGLLGGLLIGVLLRLAIARRAAGPGRTAVVVATSGLLVGALLAVLLHLYGDRITGVGGDFGWYAYSPLGRDGVLYGGAGPAWWPLVLTGAAVGLAVGAVGAVGAVLVPRLRSRRA